MSEPLFLPRANFQKLIDALVSRRYRCVGPQARDGAVVFDDITHVSELPAGYGDRQGPGHYRLEERADERLFGWANGPQALKPLLFTPREVLWDFKQDGDRAGFEPVLPETAPMAVFGVRSCDLSALAIHDAHFLRHLPGDPHYARRREGLFIVAVNCSHPAETCFCASTGDGPAAQGGYDLLLDELDDGFVIRAGSEGGTRVLEALGLGPADSALLTQAREQLRRAADRQIRKLPGRDLYGPLFNNLEHPRWEEVAQRCLSCANCTSVCPTCFCHAQREAPSLDGKSSEHYREWDSCFTEGHSYIHGIVIRDDTPKRYRQWLTHKLGSWHGQFGRSGCVGCGRCITWCPTGIDITEEAAVICGQDSDSKGAR
jgi:sulfhydrogenase subunit beta (sulfur reductase)